MISTTKSADEVHPVLLAVNLNCPIDLIVEEADWPWPLEVVVIDVIALGFITVPEQVDPVLHTKVIVIAILLASSNKNSPVEA
jgi:hypothetical protein